MSESLTEAIDELANPNRADKPPEPQSHPDPAARRPRLIRNAPTLVIVVVVLAAATATGWATHWALSIPAVKDALGQSLPRLARLALALIAAIIVGGLCAWLFRPAQTLRRGFRTSLTWLRRRTARVLLLAAVLAAGLVGLGLAAWATRLISGRLFEPAPFASTRFRGRYVSFDGATLGDHDDTLATRLNSTAQPAWQHG